MEKTTDISAISGANSTTYQVSSSANLSDMGVYTCEVTVSGEGNSPHVISVTGSVNITLTVVSKWYKRWIHFHDSITACSLLVACSVMHFKSTRSDKSKVKSWNTHKITKILGVSIDKTFIQMRMQINKKFCILCTKFKSTSKVHVYDVQLCVYIHVD